ncbi:MAG TPA: tRNA (5-methylaminomethyl-2-thiouridine)(34)-methyltransferase MnmD [Bacteroidales bacterium]|nr:tRNA (5-methylaminomethyl-2-thiouridine)(34)-methyltransferase MnmD [Bacteroidales bacterium]HPR56807.1 tRNA (5-methylaminomethyl-2-thiouridine)(34)-methyltransferase MnmD [Bacteroidales bacterium]HRW96019.1 tRNA (5-methylaminomethyl-2-thiouridine)(34)-methyltransferase MnmD [Bacteroidales bacterium]
MPENFMQHDLQLRITNDGSHTLFVPSLSEHYHSVYGAIQESRHVFIETGFRKISHKYQNINILEVGFGTGLNALLTLLSKEDSKIHYVAVEAFPLDELITEQLNYSSQIDSQNISEYFTKLHQSAWNNETEIVTGFFLKKISRRIETIVLPQNNFHLVYFDAFAPDKQPDIWQIDVFKIIFDSMRSGGILTTYTSKGLVKETLKSAGFTLERLPGPPGKRHMLRATKP